MTQTDTSQRIKIYGPNHAERLLLDRPADKVRVTPLSAKLQEAIA